MNPDDIFKCVMFWALTPVAWQTMKDACEEGGINLFVIPLCLLILFMSFGAIVYVISKII